MSLIPSALAHEGEEVIEAVTPSLTEIIHSNQINFTLATIAALFVLTLLAIIFNKINQKVPPTSSGPLPSSLPTAVPIPTVPTQVTTSVITPSSEAEVVESKGAWWKTILFGGMVLVILGNSAYLVGSTLYINAKSVTGGPVHWHGDFEVWNCGQELELVDPKPPSNRVGSPLLHEHNDKEIHIEEAVFDWKDINLGTFFKVVGGDLHSDYLKFPANEGVVEMRNGDLCPDGSPATLQVFLYKAGSFTQQRLENPEDYLITHEQKVPPGDCLIFEFGPVREQTDKLCQSYQVSKEKQHAQ